MQQLTTNQSWVPSERECWTIKHFLQDSVWVSEPRASFALPCNRLGTDPLSSLWRSAAAGCRGRWEDLPSAHPVPSNTSRPTTGMAADSATTCWGREEKKKTAFTSGLIMFQTWGWQTLNTILILRSCQIKSILPTAETFACHLPFLFLPVSFLTRGGTQVLPLLQFLSCCFQYVALNCSGQLGYQRSHQPHARALWWTVEERCKPNMSDLWF